MYVYMYIQINIHRLLLGAATRKQARHGSIALKKGGNQSLHPDVHYFKAQGSVDSPTPSCPQYLGTTAPSSCSMISNTYHRARKAKCH